MDWGEMVKGSAWRGGAMGMANQVPYFLCLPPTSPSQYASLTCNLHNYSRFGICNISHNLFNPSLDN